MDADRDALTWLGRPALAALSLACAALAGFGYWLGDGYIDRLSNHDGYFLVPAGQGTPSMQPKSRPRRTVFVLVDGLRADFAKATNIAKRLGKEGACMSTRVGELTVSKPVYAVYSTGLEADRTGARNNDETTALAATSIWASARKAGLSVHGASDVHYWQELFPNDFDRFVVDETRENNVFTEVELGDLTLIHASYPDAAGHDYGAASAEYQAAAERTDREMSALVDGLDLSRDLVVFTADHGHVDLGGHGGPDPLISEVWTCFAGPGISRTQPPARFDARTVAPTLAVMLGLEFPANMRAGDDDLDSMWKLVDGQALGKDYVAARKREIDKMRADNAVALKAWLGADDATWTKLYQRARGRQIMGLTIGLAVLALIWIAMLVGLYRRPRPIAAHWLWAVAMIVVSSTVYSLMRDSFDFTSINLRTVFIRTSVISIVATTVILAGAHLWLTRSVRVLAADLFVLTAVLALASLAHRWIYGVPLGFPLPSRFELFFPFMGAAWVMTFGAMAAVACAIAAAVRR